MNQSIGNFSPSLPNINIARRPVLAAGGALALAFGLHHAPAVAADTVPVSPAPVAGEATAHHPTLTFDDLQGGLPIIRVYPGIKDTAADREYNGTFKNGQHAAALCKALGRTVHSDPSVGEKNRSSDWWIQIKGSPGKRQYATATYTLKPAKLLKRLHECKHVR